MPRAELPQDEDDRLAALNALDLLDSAAEAEFDAIVNIATKVCSVPISLITLVDANRQWFKANIGLDGITEMTRDAAFCAHAILGTEIMEVSDAEADPRFRDNPLVIGDPNIRFYAGVPLTLSSGHNLGTLCVIDREPAELSGMQRALLHDLARIVTRLIEGRSAIRDQKQTQDALKVSDARFKALADSAPVGIFRANAGLDRTYANQRWQEIWGLSEEQSLGTKWRDFIHPDDLARMDALFFVALDEKSDLEGNYRIIRPDGEVRYLHSKARPLLDQSGKITDFIGTLEDETDRVLALRHLSESHEHMRRLYEATPAMLHSIDNAGKLSAVSDMWLKKLGYQREEVIGRHSTDFLTEQSRAYARSEAMPAFFKTGSCENIHYEMVTKSGDILDVSLSAILDYPNDPDQPPTSFAVTEDITERHRAERALQEAHQRMRVATESGGIGIWEWDLASGRFIWDDLVLKIFGLTTATDVLSYQDFFRFLHPDDRDRVTEETRLAISGEKPFDTEYRIVWNDGSVHHVRATAHAKRNADGRALRFVGASIDVTEYRELSAALSAQHELLRVTLHSIGDAVISTDAGGLVVWMNAVAERMTGWTAAEALGKPLSFVFSIINELTRKICEDPVASCLLLGNVVGLANHTVLISRDGTEYGIEDSAAPIRDAEGNILGAVLVFHDVTERRRLANEMSYRASHDDLTGLVNRSEFEIRLQRALQRAQEDSCMHALVYIDLDQFKVVNDTCGHAVGDLLLKQVAKLFRDSVREGDTVSRLGGDEFAIILEYCGLEKAQGIARTICERMDEFRFSHEGRRFRVGTSIGVVPIDEQWLSTGAILQAADSACYVAKDAGRNRVHLWNDSDKVIQGRRNEVKWTTLIEQALDEDGFLLYAQIISPIVRRSVAGGEAEHVSASKQILAEVLVRMRLADGTIAMPGQFLPAAERFHLASRIDRWVVGAAIRWMRDFPRASEIETLSINLSGQSVGDLAFHGWLLDQIEAAGAAIAHRLCFEITETSAINNLVDAGNFVDRLRSVGVKVALDDFGAGASSFGYLRKLNVDTLKIDGQFIQNLLEEALDDAAVRCFADVARVIGMKTVAEWVDSETILRRLEEIGIDYVQGFLLDRPKPIDQLFDAFGPASCAARSIVANPD